MEPIRYVFVGGLHRSGTTLVASLLEAHSEVRGLSAAPVPEGEGVFLQGAIPHDALAGVPGQFAERPEMHLTEGCRFDSAAVRDRLRSDWDLWYPPGGRWRVENSPVNLLRARLYQQLFPASQFVFVTRHPLAVARATAKWSDRGEAALLGHWSRAHELLLGDLPYLHNWMVIRFEDLCARPESEIARLFAFLSLDPPAAAPIVDGGRGGAYLDQGPPEGPCPGAAAFGYDLRARAPAVPCPVPGAHWFRDVREAITRPPA